MTLCTAAARSAVYDGCWHAQLCTAATLRAAVRYAAVACCVLCDVLRAVLCCAQPGCCWSGGDRLPQSTDRWCVRRVASAVQRWRTQVLADGALLLTSFSLPLAAWSTHVVLGNQLRPGACKGSRGWWWWCRGVVEHLWILCSPSSVVTPTQLLPLTDNCSLSCTAHVAARNQVVRCTAFGCAVKGCAVAGGPPPSPWCDHGAHVWAVPQGATVSGAVLGLLLQLLSGWRVRSHATQAGEAGVWLARVLTNSMR
jgi:hypothetical protein